MKYNIGRYCAWVAIIIGLYCQLAAAQGESAKPQEEPIDTKTTTRVTLGNATGTPGVSVVVPIYFTPAQEVSVGRVKLELSFVSANLKYGKLEKGIAGEMGNVEFKTDLKAEKNDKGIENSTLVIEATTADSGKTAIPAGLLGYVSMKISETGRPAKIAIRLTAQAAEAGTGKAVTNIRAFNGEVEVFAEGTLPSVSCFFFSH